MFFGERENPALNNIRFLRPLIWPEDDRMGGPSKENVSIQTTKSGSSIKISSGEIIHCTAEITSAVSHDDILDISNITQKCKTVMSGAELYRKFASIGLSYGPNFQVIQQMMLGDEEAIAEIRSASDASQRVQTTLLDGCFQLVIASLGQFNTAYLPVKLDMLKMTVPKLPLDERLIAYANVTDCDSSSITGEAFLCTSNGRVLIKVAGLMAKSLKDSNSGVDLESCLFTTEWQSVRSCLPPTSDVCAVFDEENLIQLFPSDMHIVRRTEAIMPTIKKICKSYIKLGLDMVDSSKIGDRKERYIRRLRAIADDTTLETISKENVHKAIDEVGVMIPEIAQELKMIKTVGNALPDTLKDPDHDASKLLAPDSRVLYFADSSTIRLFYKAGAEAIARAVEKALTQKQVIRILEVGGRTGGLSKYIVGLLEEQVKHRKVEYIFTGMNVSLLEHAKQNLKQFPLIKYKQFDVEEDIEVQGFIPGSVDIVVCLDTLHSAVDVNNGMYHMRNLLSKDGWLFMYEVTNSNYMAELLFGSLELCKEYEDFRQESCWLTRKRWESLFRERGYCDVVSVSTPNELIHSIVIGRKTGEVHVHSTETKGDGYILFGFSDTVVQNCIQKSTGRPCLMVQTPTIDDINSYTKAKLARIIYWCGEWDADLHFLLTLLKMMDCHGDTIIAIYIVTQGAQKREGNPWSHAAFGLAGSVCNHIRSGSVYYIDLDTQGSLQQNTQILCSILTDPRQPERALIIRGNELFCQRIINTTKVDILPKNVKYWRLGKNLHLNGRSASLEDLGFCALQGLSLKPNKVLVKILATALNFKDVMMAHGMLQGLESGDTLCLGLECSGVVEEVGEGVNHLKVGDEVIAFTETSFASHVISDAGFVIHKPKNLSMMESASFAVSFTTAYYSLVERANLQQGEWVLIHSACGGVGLSAIQIAKMLSAKIICSVGTEEKRSYLRNELGIKYVTDSRSDQFYHDVMKWTNGEGVSVVLNSLYGRLMERGLAALAPGGRFCEIGKRDILENSQLGLKTFLENKSFLSCQIDIRLQNYPKGMQCTLEKVVQLFEDGKLSPIPLKVYHIANYLEAFRMMAKGQHIGKVVLNVGQFVPAKCDYHGEIFHERATYLVTGGFGGIGQALVRWMQNMGAKHLVMVSRSGAKSSSAHRTLNLLKHKGVEVHSFAADVSEYKNVKSVLDNIRSDPGIPPLRGIFHLAGVVDETLLPDLTPVQLDLVLRSKAKSAYHLHNLTKDENLDIFFLMSSVSTLRGQSAQPAYCAANSVLDALAEYRHTLGLPALSLQLGALRGAGHLESRPETTKILESQGTATLHINELLETLGNLLTCYNKPVVCFAYQDWKATSNFTHRTNLKFRHLIDDTCLNKTDCQLSIEDLEDMVKQKLGQMICQSPEDIDITKPMTDYGVDSLMAVEMVNWASKELNVFISQLDILGGMTTSLLLEKAVENILVLHQNTDM
ncbi:uncharacterized protein [Ptychodera flava]|uniref:uncharacterized protein n=1 Tax=Ptychodera flava TaxID=63121 RepID=UPI003969E281